LRSDLVKALRNGSRSFLPQRAGVPASGRQTPAGQNTYPDDKTKQSNADPVGATASRGPCKRGIERRRQVVVTVTEVFGEKGFRGGTLQQVADRVGGTPAAILKLFGSKEKLLIAVLEHRDTFTSELVMQGTPTLAYLDGLEVPMSYHVEHKGLLQLIRPWRRRRPRNSILLMSP
jgi:AcrR family transcriptional regulator